MRNYIKTLVFVMLLTITAAVTAQASVIYTVKEKDTLWKISQEFNVSMESILKANPELTDERSLKSGMALLIPDESEDFIPLDEESSGTHTLVVHGSGTPYQTPLEKNVNIMTVDGKTINVPTYQMNPPASANRQAAANANAAGGSGEAPYRSKYNTMSSRTLPGATSGTSSGIVKTAFGFMGVPYVYGGSTPQGFDCSGFVQYVYRLNGKTTPRMAHHQFYAGTPIKKSDLRPGDLVFFETYTKGISHVGIYIGNNNFIHASSKGAVRVDSLGTQYYQNRYRGAARY